jgi:hypothetical protein
MLGGGYPSDEREDALNEDLRIAEPAGAEYVVKNRLQPLDESMHGWYRFVLGYPPHLVREYLKTLERKRNRFLKQATDYDEVILEVFLRHYCEGASYLKFEKDELAEACVEHGITVRNIPDIIYTYRSRRMLPAKILATGHWAIEPAGRGSYAFRLLRNPSYFEIPFGEYAPVDIYNAIPEVVEGLLRQDEQSLLTRILYNRLIDIFTGLTCFHIQNHYRSFVTGMGEVELDALYVGVNKTGTLFVLPIEAKSQGESERIGRIQVSQMAKLVRQDFPDLRRRILAVKALAGGTIAVVEFDDHEEPDDFGIVFIGRFRLIRRETTVDKLTAKKRQR